MGREVRREWAVLQFASRLKPLSIPHCQNAVSGSNAAIYSATEQAAAERRQMDGCKADVTFFRETHSSSLYY